LAQTAERIAPGQAQIINFKQISNHNARLSAGLFGGNDQAEPGSIELSSMIKTRLRRTPSSRLFGVLCLFIGICLLFGISYLVLTRQKDYVARPLLQCH
jgi:hypothetical protein